MEFSYRQRKTGQNNIRVNAEIDELEKRYPHNVMLYNLSISPIEDVLNDEFKELALERLKLLRIFEQASLRNLRFLSDEWKEYVVKELNYEGLKGYLRLFTGRSGSSDTQKELDLQARRRDYISHFILRLPYCRSDDLKRWFVTREMEILKYKFSVLNSSDIRKFIEINQMNYIPLTDEQKNEIKSGLFSSTLGINNITIESLDFYKVPFTEVLDLVKMRKCFLKSGYAYVNTHDFLSITTSLFQSIIEKGLEKTQELLPIVENDERICYFIKGLHTSYIGKDYTIQKNSLPIECLDQLSKKSFPICMRMCHETLRTKHHLKHGGRMQYGLFLKGIGVTLEDSLRFWREEFTKVMDLERFEKSYAYNVRHNYGKEGSMLNYTPYSCMKIITTSAGPQDTHGCPFKIYDQTALKTKLTNYGLSAAHVQEVASYAAKGHYQLACTKYFEIIHETTCDRGISHPNQYFELSQTTMKARVPNATKVDARNMPGTSSTPQQQKQRKSISTVNDSERNKNGSAALSEDDDDELWNIAETGENLIGTKVKNQNGPWDGDDYDFDMSHIEENDQ